MNSTIFSGTRGSKTPKYVFVGEAYGATEAREQRPFVGTSGRELSKIIAECGIPENECLFTNVVNKQPIGNDPTHFFWPTKEARANRVPLVKGLYPREVLIEGLDRLKELLQTIAEYNPKVIALGNYALWALTDDFFGVGNKYIKKMGANQSYKVPTGIMDRRGSALFESLSGYNFDLMPCIHPASCLRDWPQRYIISHDIRQRLKATWTEPEYNFLIKPTFMQAEAQLQRLLNLADKGELWLANDHEALNGMIACTSLAWSETDAICIPFMTTSNKEGYWSEEEELRLVFLLRKLLLHPNIRLCGQNYLYDAQHNALWWGTVRAPDHDTMIMQHLCWPGTPLSLNHISSLYCRYHKYWKDEGKELNTDVGEEQGWRYNCKDAVATLEAAKALRKLISHLKLDEQYATQQRELLSILKRMIRGVRVDKEERFRVAKELGRRSHEIADWLESIMPSDVYTPPRKKNGKLTKAPWYRSNQQLMEIFYDRLGLTPIKNHKTGQRTVNDQALELITKREPVLIPIIRSIQSYRSIGKFAEFTEQKLDSDDRMRCSWTPTAETFRTKSSQNIWGGGGNLQNLPKGAEDEE